LPQKKPLFILVGNDALAMSSLAGATAADAVTTSLAGATAADAVTTILQTPPPTAAVTALNSAPTAPTSPVSGTKISLATPDLTAIRKAGKESIKQLGPLALARKAEFNVERDKAVGRISQAVGFDGITDTIAVTPKLKGIIDHSKVSKCEFDRSVKSIYERMTP
jgi:hypothetical protein